jgi:lysophospholipid acyltransferase (LPLAT)-like uncharacterized protein
LALRIDHNSRFGRVVLGLAGQLVRLLLVVVGSTWRIEVVAGQDVLRRILADQRPAILCFWHNRLVLSAYFLYRRVHGEGFPLTLLASQSRDGELVTQMVKSWGIDTVRGSATRGGRQALRAIHRAITQNRSSPVMTPDGPKGPLYHFKAGVAVLAQTTGAPILPLGFAARSAWALRSWDRIVVPRPFTRIAVTLGEPQHLPKDLSSEALETERQRLEQLLLDLTQQAEAAAKV